MDYEAATANFLRAPSAPLEGTPSAANALQRVHYTHDAMVNLLIANPAISQNDIAKHFGYSVPWVSRIINSDAFQARLAARKNDIIDPGLAATVDEKLRAVASRSLDLVLEKLEVATFGQALEAAAMAGKALGYGARQQNLNLQANFVVAMPQQAPDAASWAKRYETPQQTAVAEAPLRSSV